MQRSIYVYLEDTWSTYRFLEDSGTVLSVDWDGCSAVFMFIWRIHGAPIDFKKTQVQYCLQTGMGAVQYLCLSGGYMEHL